MRFVKTRQFVVWLALLILTGFSLTIADSAAIVKRVGASDAIVVLVALYKIRLVGLEYMEIRTAPVLLKSGFNIWIISIGVGILSVTYLIH